MKKNNKTYRLYSLNNFYIIITFMIVYFFSFDSIILRLVYDVQ